MTDNTLPILSATRFQPAWVQFGGTAAGLSEFTIARLTVTRDAVGTLIGETSGTLNVYQSTPIVEAIIPDSRPLALVTGDVRLVGQSGLFTDAIVYDDVDNDAVRDIDEPFTEMGSTSYAFLLSPGTHRLRAEVDASYTVASPAGGAHVVTLADGEVLRPVDFLMQRAGTAVIQGSVKARDRLTNLPAAGQAGVTVFLDANTDGVLNASETFTFTALALNQSLL